jgi:hypothetical protein
LSSIEDMMEKTKRRRKELVSRAGDSLVSLVDAVPHPLLDRRPFAREPLIKTLLRRRRE